jgi:hypothetical protein
LPSYLSIAGESVWSFQAWCEEPVMRFWQFQCARQQDMVSIGREVVGLELSGCCVVSTCCSKVGEHVVSEGVALHLELLGKQIVVARFLMISVKF